MNYIITGCSGFIGTHLVASLARSGNRGILMDRCRPASVPEGFQWVPWEAGHPVVLPKPLDDACVIHLVAKHHVPNPGAADVRAFQEINVEGTRRLLEDCARLGIQRFVHFSTIKAAGPQLLENHHPVKPVPRRETDPESGVPETVYGRSKREAEMWVQRWAGAAADRAALILRPAVVYGPGNTANMYSLLEAIDKRRFFLAGDNANPKSLVSVANLVAAVQHLVPRMNPGCQTYYVTDRDVYSMRELAGLLVELLNLRHPVRSLPLTLLRVLALAGDGVTKITGWRCPIDGARLSALIETTWFSCEKLVATGFQHPQTTREGLVEMVEWYLSRTARELPRRTAGRA